MGIEEDTKRRLLSNTKLTFWVSPLQNVKFMSKNDGKNTVVLSDIIEENIDKKYLLTETQIKKTEMINQVQK